MRPLSYSYNYVLVHKVTIKKNSFGFMVETLSDAFIKNYLKKFHRKVHDDDQVKGPE